MSPTAVEDRAATPAATIEQRRELLVDRRYQLRVSLLAVATALVLLVLLNLALYRLSVTGTERTLAEAPRLEQMLRAQDRVQFLLIGLASIVFLAGVFAVGIFESHRTAGAALNLARRLREVADGRYDAQVSLRRGDDLTELQAAFNAMTKALRDRQLHEADVLGRLAAELAGEPSARRAAEVAGELRDLARRKSHTSD